MPEIKCPKCQTIFSIDEKEYDSILKAVRDDEFERSLKERMRIEEEKNYQKLKLLEVENKNEQIKREADLKAKIEKLENDLRLKESESKLAMQKAVNEKEKEIDRLNNTLLLQRNEEQQRLKEKDEQIAFYKDLKVKMSTKLLGETLEQHCQIEFNKIRMTAFPTAYFEKDNDARTGSKGDYIFKENTEQGAELISIMFEMKNENDETATKHKNEDFLKELDKDRKEKNCEYAVLVSTLEPENELYNAGIVDVSYKFEKMYVVRPQCFIPIITLLRNAALNAAQYKNQLVLANAQHLDITNFEKELDDFKNNVDYNVGLARNKYAVAIEEIDKTIAHLQKVRDNLTGSDSNLRIANDKVQSLTVKKLTKNSPKLREELKIK